MVVAYEISEETVRVVVKGAPEYVIPMCTRTLDDINDSEEFNEEQAREHLEKVSKTIREDNEILKPLTYAFRDMNLAEFDELKHANDEFETESSRACLETELTFAATFFLADPLRAGVHHATIALHESGVNTRILSGDHE